MPGGGLYKSTDGGDTWRQLTGGLPTDDFVGKIGIAVAPSDPNRLYAVVDDLGTGVARPIRGAAAPAADAPKSSGGIYLSDDAGTTWRLINNEQRLWGRGWYFGQITVDPTNPDRVYDINTATYMTLDAGKTWLPVKGAPGGDDYHQLWINPKDGNRMVLSSDQGTVVSVDGAKILEHLVQPANRTGLSRRRRQPLPLLALRCATGLRRSRRQHLGRAWAHSASATGNPPASPARATLSSPIPKTAISSTAPEDQRCNQALNLPSPTGGKLPPPDQNNPDRKTWTLPQVFSVADEALYYSNQFVFRTRDRGRTWQQISPDLARLHPEIPKTLDPVTAKDIDQPMTDRFGVVYSIGPSPIDAKTVLGRH